MRGGTRYGAGRPGWRGRCESKLRLDIRTLQRAGNLKPGTFGWQWLQEGSRTASIMIRVHEGVAFLTLTYQANGQPRSCAFAIERTSCHFGGKRPWIRCRCQRRCAVLYGVSADGYFACRQCLHLGYRSESLSPEDRAWRKVQKLEARLGEEGERPKGMHRRTYERLCKRLEEAEDAKDALFDYRILHFAQRYGIPL